MKKIVSLALAAAMMLSLAACGSSKPAETTAAAAATAAATTAAATTAAPETTAAPAASSAAAETKAPETTAAPATEAPKKEIPTVTPGKLTVATSPDFAPYEFYAIDENNQPHLAGFDMALAQYIADYLGLELEVIPMDFDGTIMELQQKNVDMSMAGYSITEERKEIMDFSIVYYGGGQAFVCTQANKDQIVDLAGANKPGLTIGAQTGSIQAGLAEKNTPDADIIQLAKVTDLVAELISGKMDGAFIEKVVAESYAKNYPELCVLCDVPYETEGTAAGISKGNTALVEAVNEAMEAAISSGEFEKMVAEANELAGGNIIEGLLN